MILYDIEPTDNKRLLLLRELNAHKKHVGEIVYVVPETIERQYGINLQTIQSVLIDLEEREHIEIQLRPNHELSYEQRLRKDDEQDYYLINLNDSFTTYYDMLEQTEAFHRADKTSSHDSQSNTMTATLSFESISVPVITLSDKRYQLSSLRDGLPLNIISYCLAEHPNEAIKLEVLKSELKAVNSSAHGLDNLRENIRNSHFGNKKPLQPFVKVSPKAILVYESVILSQQELDQIIAASK